MDLSLQPKLWVRRFHGGHVVSILVLMDLSLQHFNILALHHYIYSFNPCFNGSFTSTFVYRHSCDIHIVVSILVLMDLSLQLGGATKFDDAIYCFNPCFN